MAFKSKRVLITGGSGCLGLETAKRFVDEGAEVIIVDKNQDALKKAKDEVPSLITKVVDLLDWEGTQKILKELCPVDHLINNAGVNQRQPFLEVTPEAIDLILGVNFKAVVNVSQVIAKDMLDRGSGGTIVNVSSFAAKVPLPRISMYSASKAALNSLTQCMAVELGPTIRVNAVCPTYMITPFTENYIKSSPATFDAMFSRAPIKRFAQPKEVVDSIMFLAGNQSSMITGTSIDIDGGYVSA